MEVPVTATESVTFWVAIVAIALGTWGFRVSFVVLFEYVDEIPTWADRGLRFIPPALLAAIVGPRLLLVDGSLAVSPANERLLAGLVAMVVAWRTEHMIATIVAGMLALWTLVFLV